MNKYDLLNLLRTKKKSIGKPPGTLVYSGNFDDVEIKMEIMSYDKDDLSIFEIKEIRDFKDFLDKAMKNKQNHWINITGLHSPDLIRLIGEQLDTHPMDLEDIIQVSQWSKIETSDDYLFSVLKMIYLEQDRILHEHVSVIMKENMIVTFQETSGDVFNYVRERLKKQSSKLRSENSSYLYYSLLDAIIDEYLVVINQISINFNNIEMQIVEESDPNKEEIYRLRKELLYFSNSLIPLMEALRKFMIQDHSYFIEDMVPYYRDLYEHLNQISNSIRGYREMSNGLHEMQMSNASMKMNQTMMTLTIFTVIFIPLSFLTGVFGMNFAHMPGLEETWAFYVFGVFCVLITVGMLSYFKLRRWK